MMKYVTVVVNVTEAVAGNPGLHKRFFSRDRVFYVLLFNEVKSTRRTLVPFFLSVFAAVSFRFMWDRGRSMPRIRPLWRVIPRIMSAPATPPDWRALKPLSRRPSIMSRINGTGVRPAVASWRWGCRERYCFPQPLNFNSRVLFYAGGRWAARLLFRLLAYA